MHDLPLVDPHLDLAKNVNLFGRDLTLSAAEIRAREKRTTRQVTSSLTILERGNIALPFATVTAGFLAAEVRDAVLSTNWLNFLGTNLPQTAV